MGKLSTAKREPKLTVATWPWKALPGVTMSDELPGRVWAPPDALFDAAGPVAWTAPGGFVEQPDKTMSDNAANRIHLIGQIE
jgi:hypothetical protein